MLRRVFIAVSLFIAPLFAQFYFGQNKIQPFDYEWEVHQSPHFDIYYYSAEEELARLTANIAEKTYSRYVSHFRYAPQERVPIVLYSAPGLFSETHTIPYIIPEGVGGFTEFIKGRIILPYNGSISDFEHILPHELVHIWQLHYSEFLHDAHELFFVNFPPLWFTEGQAELLSQPDEPQAERMEIVALLANDRLVLPQYFYAIEGTYQMYKEGANFLRFLSEKYGKDTDVRLYERVWEHSYFDDIFKSVIDENIEDAGLLWRQWLLKRFGKYIASRTPQKVSGEIFFPDGWFFSPEKLDSNTIICKGNKMGYTGLYVLKNKKAKLLHKIELTESAEATKLFENGIGILGDSLVAYSAKSKGKDRLFVENIKTGKKSQFDFEEIITIGSPALSKDGTLVYFSGATLDGYTDLWQIEIKTGNLTRLTDDSNFDSDPVALSGDSVAFVSDRNDADRMGIYVFSNGAIEELADGAPFFRPKSLSISQNGKYLAFAADDDTFPDAYILDIESDSLWRATRITECIYDVSFAGGAVRCENRGLSCCTLLVSVSSGDNVVIQRIPVDSMEFIGVFPQKPASDFKTLPVIAPSLTGTEEKSKPGAHRLTFDLAQGEISTASAQEMGGGIELMLSDMMGDRRLYLFFLEAAHEWNDIFSDANFVVSYDKQGLRWGNTIGAYHIHMFSYDRYEGLYDERQAGILASTRYSLSRFTRIEGTGFLYFSDRNDREFQRQDGIVSANLSLIRDTSLWGITGPLDGMRANITVGLGAGFSQKLYHYLGSADIRHYLRLSKRTCWAHRIIARHSEGEEPRRFYMGGTWDFRGYPYFYFFGKNQALFNSELRFPLLDRVALRTPVIDVDLQGIRGALFFDAGDAWEIEPEFVGSYGLGARMSLEGYIVLRFDLAQRTDFHSIDPHWNWDLFFGWDF